MKDSLGDWSFAALGTVLASLAAFFYRCMEAVWTRWSTRVTACGGQVAVTEKVKKRRNMVASSRRKTGKLLP